MAYDSNINYVRVKLLDLDAECQMDLASGKGIRIDSVESFGKSHDSKKPNEKIYHGLQSEFFGTDFSEEDAFRERYSCKCGKYIGKVFEGLTCEICSTKVQYADIDLTKYGWIILDHFKIISPIFAEKLSDILGKYDGQKYLEMILKTSYNEDTGEIKYTEKEELDLKKFPYLHKGMQWLSENILEILEVYEKKKPNKHALIQQCKDNIDRIFTSCIPVYSSLLRTELPGERGGKDFRMKVNTTYRAIIRLVNSINHHQLEDIDQKVSNSIDRQLAAIQRELNIIFTQTYTDLTSKNGIIVSKVLGKPV